MYLLGSSKLFKPINDRLCYTFRFLAKGTETSFGQSLALI